MAYLSFIDDDEAWKLNDHSCSTTYLKKLVVVDDKGRQHLKTLQFCKCEVEAVRLIRFNLWPSSTKFPNVAFHFDFMRWLCGLLLESSVSFKSFCSALDAWTSKHMKTYIHHPVKDLYKVLVGGTADEFRHFIYQMENIHDDGSKCPACYEDSPSLISLLEQRI
ncbi:hypothetical protein DPMN_089375 [Dreissena polymorpha]|uniref:CxC2-like cysteine cluster KDZ transposase-associated domain-containing protein n=1 Tax=Dreissena polymorpha TaxID=45954 RepID=A0A9D4JSL0_DREPO|nr:hypothetical protein DPMN_120309 [Dreissena polymorpha]KAH3847063.1 hypothetical protein DPMN_089375 [Dreissena polymorpha]